MATEICCGFQNIGHYRKDCPKHKREMEEDYSTKEVKKPKTTKKLKKEEAKISLL